MPVELKVSICLFIVGMTNVFLRNNRNWIFGYRSPRAIKSHKSYAYANLIYGAGMTLISAAYLLMMFFFLESFEKWSQTQHGIFAILYFAVLFLIIELKLRQVFKND